MIIWRTYVCKLHFVIYLIATYSNERLSLTIRNRAFRIWLPILCCEVTSLVALCFDNSTKWLRRVQMDGGSKERNPFCRLFQKATCCTTCYSAVPPNPKFWEMHPSSAVYGLRFLAKVRVQAMTKFTTLKWKQTCFLWLCLRLVRSQSHFDVPITCFRNCNIACPIGTSRKQLRLPNPFPNVSVCEPRRHFLFYRCLGMQTNPSVISNNAQDIKGTCIYQEQINCCTKLLAHRP